MKTTATIDGNEAAATIAYRLNEVIAIYPITPSSNMGELADAWAANKEPNLWGVVPTVVEMQSEGGAAGACHGALAAGALTTTFTASQGLLLMIPNMLKIAGELTPTVFHISARTLATHALSIFGDHSDVMACRSTGWGMLFGANVQEVQDMALIAQAATLEGQVPFLNVFDGFRTSHEVQRIELIDDESIAAMIHPQWIEAHRARALDPDRPTMRGTAQNPDVFFQAREACNPWYDALPGLVQSAMNRFASLTGRRYHLFDYHGHPEAERVVVLMGSGVETAQATADHLNGCGERVGVLQVRLFRPFSVDALAAALPPTVRALAVLDRTKEPGAAGEPLYQDVITALVEAGRSPMPRVVGGRYGLSSKEFTPAMARAVFAELAETSPKNHFTVGIHDDVTHRSLAVPEFELPRGSVRTAVFWGLGSDGTVGANKNTIKIIGEKTDLYAQGYFVYDSKKSGSVTTSHLRFGPEPIRAPYLVSQADFTGVHQFGLLYRYPVLEAAAQGSILLVNSPYGSSGTWDELPLRVQRTILERELNVWVIDADQIARDTGMGRRINTIMQTAHFALAEVMPQQDAISAIKEAIHKTYWVRGQAVVDQNCQAVDRAVSGLARLQVGEPNAVRDLAEPVAPGAPAFVERVTSAMIAGRGDLIPVSQLPADGTFPTATSQWEKRCISTIGPVWDPDVCIQCGKCVVACPHAVIRAKVVSTDALYAAPEGFQSLPAKFKATPGSRYTLQRSMEDCTGCAICVEVCPAKNKSVAGRKALYMEDITASRERDRGWWEYFLHLTDQPPLEEAPNFSVKQVQLNRPLFEFSGACAGCGETPYVGLLTRMFGDRALIANATGCSSIYGGNLPTTPYAVNDQGKGPAWANSLFEDNAEFGLGMRLAVDALRKNAELAGVEHPVDRSVWILGGDGWAYDIGFGGLDHVLAMGHNVNILVLDTEVYSNTGGQASKSTGRGAVAKFAAGGKPGRKKDLGMIAMSYGNVYVASVAMGANDNQTVKAFAEAEAHRGPSIILAYSHCIAHGIDMTKGMAQQKLAVESGYWPLYRYNPSWAAEGRNPFRLDSRPPAIPLADYLYTENRYRMLRRSDPEAAAELLELAKQDVLDKWATLERLAGTAKETA